jgi:hypothetical protein
MQLYLFMPARIRALPDGRVDTGNSAQGIKINEKLKKNRGG